LAHGYGWFFGEDGSGVEVGGEATPQEMEQNTDELVYFLRVPVEVF